MKTKPWEYHADLTEERLVEIAKLIVAGRNAAIELQAEDEGDNGWTLGCRAVQFARHRILTAAANGTLPYLGIIDPSLGLVFTIGQVPVRIYRGDADDPTDRTLRQSNTELHQLGFIFDDLDDASELAYRFAIETDFDGSVLSVHFVGLRGKVAELNWRVPLDEDDGVVGGVGTPADEAVDIPAPSVSIPAHKKQTGTDSE